jgi:hypothetical protein
MGLCEELSLEESALQRTAARCIVGPVPTNYPKAYAFPVDVSTSIGYSEWVPGHEAFFSTFLLFLFPLFFTSRSLR